MNDDYAYVFAIFFVTLGPLKTIPVFHALTYDSSRAYSVHLAIRAFVMSFALVLFIAFSASENLSKWHVGIDALMIAGGMILFVTALRSITDLELVSLPEPSTSPRPDGARPPWTGKPTLSPLVIPTIVTPAAVVAIIFFIARSAGDQAFRHAVLATIGGIMLLNLLGMLAARAVMRRIGVPILQVIGWVFSVLQAGLAIQAMLEALRRLQIIP